MRRRADQPRRRLPHHTTGSDPPQWQQCLHARSWRRWPRSCPRRAAIGALQLLCRRAHDEATQQEPVHAWEHVQKLDSKPFWCALLRKRDDAVPGDNMGRSPTPQPPPLRLPQTALYELRALYTHEKSPQGILSTPPLWLSPAHHSECLLTSCPTCFVISDTGNTFRVQSWWPFDPRYSTEDGLLDPSVHK